MGVVAVAGVVAVGLDGLQLPQVVVAVEPPGEGTRERQGRRAAGRVVRQHGPFDAQAVEAAEHVPGTLGLQHPPVRRGVLPKQLAMQRVAFDVQQVVAVVEQPVQVARAVQQVVDRPEVLQRAGLPVPQRVEPVRDGVLELDGRLLRHRRGKSGALGDRLGRLVEPLRLGNRPTQRIALGQRLGVQPRLAVRPGQVAARGDQLAGGVPLQPFDARRGVLGRRHVDLVQPAHGVPAVARAQAIRARPVDHLDQLAPAS